jgi:hypothetical protein
MDTSQTAYSRSVWAVEAAEAAEEEEEEEEEEEGQYSVSTQVVSHR